MVCKGVVGWAVGASFGSIPRLCNTQKRVRMSHMCIRGLDTWEAFCTICAATPALVSTSQVSTTRACFGHINTKKVSQGLDKSQPPLPYSNPTPFSEPCTPYKHINNIFAARQALISAWTTLKHSHVLAKIHSKVQVGGDKKRNGSDHFPPSYRIPLSSSVSPLSIRPSHVP
jgi:hypothetical protein